MEQALKERMSKLNSLLVEVEKFWEEVGDMEENLQALDEQFSAQQPPSILEDVLAEQIETNRGLEDILLLRKGKLQKIDEYAASLRTHVHRDDSLKVIKLTVLKLR